MRAAISSHSAGCVLYDCSPARAPFAAAGRAGIIAAIMERETKAATPIALETERGGSAPSGQESRQASAIGPRSGRRARTRYRTSRYRSGASADAEARLRCSECAPPAGRRCSALVRAPHFPNSVLERPGAGRAAAGNRGRMLCPRRPHSRFPGHDGPAIPNCHHEAGERKLGRYDAPIGNNLQRLGLQAVMGRDSILYLVRSGDRRGSVVEPSYDGRPRQELRIQPSLLESSA